MKRRSWASRPKPVSAFAPQCPVGPAESAPAGIGTFAVRIRPSTFIDGSRATIPGVRALRKLFREPSTLRIGLPPNRLIQYFHAVFGNAVADRRCHIPEIFSRNEVSARSIPLQIETICMPASRNRSWRLLAEAAPCRCLLPSYHPEFAHDRDAIGIECRGRHAGRRGFADEADRAGRSFEDAPARCRHADEHRPGG